MNFSLLEKKKNNITSHPITPTMPDNIIIVKFQDKQ
jgi:hypothetical protein